MSTVLLFLVLAPLFGSAIIYLIFAEFYLPIVLVLGGILLVLAYSSNIFNASSVETIDGEIGEQYQ